MSRTYTNESQQSVWFIAHNSADIVHVGELSPGLSVETGQPELETFDSEEEWNNRKQALGYVEESEDEHA